jgi:AAA+ superfamily predicted ATPase
MTSIAKLITAIKRQQDAGTGIVLVRTMEPKPVAAALMKSVALAPDGKVAGWNIVQGWQWTESNVPKTDPDSNPFSAMMKITDKAGDGKNAMKSSVFFVEGLHPFLGAQPNPQITQLLRQYAVELPLSEQRMILVMPDSYVLPDELQHDIPIIDHELPLAQELSEKFREMVSDNCDVDGADSLVPENGIDSINFRKLAEGALGMTLLEAETALSLAMVDHHSSRLRLSTDTLLKPILSAKTEAVKRSEVLEYMPVNEDLEVGGLDNLKDWMNIRKQCFTQEARDFGVDRPKGIALLGPPGTGKSLSAKAISQSLGQPLIRFDVGRVFGSLVGQSEQRVRSALKLIEAIAPCVCFIDEVDKAGLDPRQGGGDSGVGKRVMGSILTFMQESKAEVFWLFTANRVDCLPPEMLRKGRLDEVWSVTAPNTREREEVLKIHLGKRKQAIPKDLSLAVQQSAGYVSAEIEAAVKEATAEAFFSGKPVTGKLIASQLSSMKPISVAFKEDFDAMQTWAKNNARSASVNDDENETIEPVAVVRKRSIRSN